jgi:hypothetical protein
MSIRISNNGGGSGGGGGTWGTITGTLSDQTDLQTALDGKATNAFTIIQPDNGTSPTADSKTDTVTLTSSDKSITIDGDSTADSITLREAGSYSAGNSSTSITINWNNGPAQHVSMTGSCTFAFSNPRSGMSYALVLTQDSTGSRTYTWPAAVKWGNAGAPTASGASKIDVVTFYYDGTNYYGSASTGF